VAFLDAFPDLHVTIEDQIVEGGKIASRWSETMTFKGAWMGIQPTNKRITMWSIYISRIVGGKYMEIWERTDTLGSMQQAGVIPTPKK
jgi:predicted ester cyclase